MKTSTINKSKLYAECLNALEPKIKAEQWNLYTEGCEYTHHVNFPFESGYIEGHFTTKSYDDEKCVGVVSESLAYNEYDKDGDLVFELELKISDTDLVDYMSENAFNE